MSGDLSSALVHSTIRSVALRTIGELLSGHIQEGTSDILPLSSFLTGLQIGMAAALADETRAREFMGILWDDLIELTHDERAVVVDRAFDLLRSVAIPERPASVMIAGEEYVGR